MRTHGEWRLFAREMERELAEMTKQRDALAACLNHLRDRDWFKDGESGQVVCCMDADKVRQSLSALNPDPSKKDEKDC